jgi:hypothetical protein
MLRLKMQKLLNIEQILNWKFNEIKTNNLKEIGAGFFYILGKCLMNRIL